LDIHLKTGRST